MWILAERADDALALGDGDVLDDLIAAADGGPPVAIVTLARPAAAAT